MIICSDIQQMLAQYLVENLRSSSRSAAPSGLEGCIVTLPIRTTDGRWISVIVEERYDHFLVHDGGKTDSALFSQGVKMSPGDEQFNSAIAAKYGVSLDRRIIQKHCPKSALSETIMAVAESSALMTAQLISSGLDEVQVQEMQSRVSDALRLWKPETVRIEQDVDVEGLTARHQLNFVTYDEDSARRTATIKILSPARSNARERAERYGFMRYDIQRNPERKNWASLAVILEPETWSGPALQIIRRIADTTLEVTNETKDEFESRLTKTMENLTAAAA